MRRTVLILFAAAVIVVDTAPGHYARGRQTRSTIVRPFTPADRLSGQYHYVPFEVPQGTGTLRVSYQYDRANGDNVIDLGLFEPGPLDLGTHAFRGYSGGARQSIILSPTETTAGYRPGPLPPGQWNLLLGLYKVRDAGVEVTIHVDAEEGPSARALPGLAKPRPKSAVAPASRWYVGALHTHTVHSDGDLAPATLMQQFRDAKFDFVAVTDHNNTTHQYELAPQHRAGGGPLWIMGEEVTTPGGHGSVWGLEGDQWVDFRVRPKDGRVGELVTVAHRHGALFSVNHPASECGGCGWTHEFVEGLDAIEIANGRHGEVDRALAIWDRLLQGGRRITGVGSSDWHRPPSPLDNAHVRVYASALTQDAILGAIRAGHVIVMSRAGDATPEIVVRSGERSARSGESLELAPSGPLRIEVTAPALTGAELIVLANGKRAATATLDPLGEARIEYAAVPGYVRVELRSADGQVLAIANPVYLVRP